MQHLKSCPCEGSRVLSGIRNLHRVEDCWASLQTPREKKNKVGACSSFFPTPCHTPKGLQSKSTLGLSSMRKPQALPLQMTLILGWPEPPAPLTKCLFSCTHGLASWKPHRCSDLVDSFRLLHCFRLSLSLTGSFLPVFSSLLLLSSTLSSSIIS